MSHKPQRPFVPHRAPKASAGIPSSSEFRLARPFVPGFQREQIADAGSAHTHETAPVESHREPALRGIEEFVETFSGVAELETVEASEPRGSQLDEVDYELPPIEHFTDPLPRVEAFAPDSDGALIEEHADAIDYKAVGTSPPIPGSAGWVEEDWQRFDWRAAAALGDTPDAEATNDWATTDWDAAAPLPRERKPSAAQAIASALDHIAQRIRNGELALPSPGDLGDPKAIAAKLAAILGVEG